MGVYLFFGNLKLLLTSGGIRSGLLMLRSFVAMGKGAGTSQVFMASQILVRGRRLGKFLRHLDVAIPYLGCVLGTIMRSLVILKNWKDSLDRRDKWIDFGKLWMFAILGI